MKQGNYFNIKSFNFEKLALIHIFLNFYNAIYRGQMRVWIPICTCAPRSSQGIVPFKAGLPSSPKSDIFKTDMIQMTGLYQRARGLGKAWGPRW